MKYEVLAYNNITEVYDHIYFYDTKEEANLASYMLWQNTEVMTMQRVHEDD